jgi:hypothetical protein
MSALDELTNIDNWKAPISYSLVLESAAELAQLRAENVRLVAEIEAWCRIVEMERDRYETTLNNPGSQREYRVIRAFLSAHPRP